jgi:transaldolase
VTLIFGIERYREVMDAYLTGLEGALDADLDLTTIRSVASFFVSRVDTEVDKRLEELAEQGGGDEALALRGKAAVANARLAYAAFEEVLDSDRWRRLLERGATRSGPCGPPPASRTPTTPTPSTSPTWWSATPSTRCRRRRLRRSPTTARSVATR